MFYSSNSYVKKRCLKVVPYNLIGESFIYVIFSAYDDANDEYQGDENQIKCDEKTKKS